MGPLGTPLWLPPAQLRLELSLDAATPSNNEIKGMHYMAYKNLRHVWQRMVYAQVAQVLPRPGPIDKAFLSITRYSSGGGLDWDNAYGGLKPLLDCLVCPTPRNPSGLGLIVDDGPAHMPYPPYFTQLNAKRGSGKTEIQIYEITAS